MGTFGLDKFIQRYEIERRVLTAGKNKALMDPFLPTNPEHKEILQRTLDVLHERFKQFVKESRKDRLKVIM